MELTRYQWEIYLKAGGQKVVDHFQHVINGDRDGFEKLIVECLFAFCPDKALIEQCARGIESVVSFENENESIQPQYQFIDDQGNPIPDQDVPFLFLNDTKAAYLEGCEKTPKEMDMFFALYDGISMDSTDWAFSAPNHCIPYYYSGCYNVLCRTAGIFGIELPAIPGKVLYNNRYEFYGKLCNVFHAFRLKNGWSAAELWAFLYDYGPKSAGGMTWIWNELPSPRKAYVFGLPADVEQEENAKHNIFCFQGNDEMQPGDIGVLYHWSPASCFSSVWRAVAPGFYDPLFTHYRYVYYGRPIEIPKITYKMLKADSVFSQTSLVKTRMLRMDGAPLKNSEYMHLLDMCAEEGAVDNDIPRLELRTEIQYDNLELERDVEIQLLEPLLERLGWTPENWCRQLPVRIGRGVIKYPDYVVKPVYTKHRESGEIVFEAKLTIPNSKQLETDRGQAHSYAVLLKSKAYVLVAKEGIWISEQKDDFKAITGYTWTQLEDEDIFNHVNALIGNVQRVNSRKKR